MCRVTYCTDQYLYPLFDHCHFLYSPFAYVDPLHCNMAYLYLELLKDSLNEYAYAAELAGLNYDLQNTVYGMYVSIKNPHPSTSRCIPDHMPPPPRLCYSSARPGLTRHFRSCVWSPGKVLWYSNYDSKLLCITVVLCVVINILDKASDPDLAALVWVLPTFPSSSYSSFVCPSSCFSFSHELQSFFSLFSYILGLPPRSFSAGVSSEVVFDQQH